jgi:hypothetical protein
LFLWGKQASADLEAIMASSQIILGAHNSCFQRGMLERTLKPITLVLIGCLALSGCAHFTKSGRQQLAYKKYVRKQSGMRARQQAKMKTPRMPSVLPPSQPKTTTEVSGSPLSVTSSESQTNE